GSQQPPRRHRRRGAGGRRDRADRARRPKLMLRSILHITGLEQKLEAVRDRIEGEAQSLMQHGKAVAIQMAIASALAASAAILGVMALVAGLWVVGFFVVRVVLGA